MYHELRACLATATHTIPIYVQWHRASLLCILFLSFDYCEWQFGNSSSLDYQHMLQKSNEFKSKIQINNEHTHTNAVFFKLTISFRKCAVIKSLWKITPNRHIHAFVQFFFMIYCHGNELSHR